MRDGDQLGQYTLVRRLGQGGFGSVWLARTARGEEVAIKVLHPKYCAPAGSMRGPSMADRFLEEARILLSLRNPGVVEVREVIEDREHATIAYVMEKLVGRDLTAVANKLDMPSLLEVFARASDTLDFLHQRGVLHRDVKLANIFVCDPARPGDSDRAVKLIDFGVAKDQWARSVAESTATGMFVGTLETMAPECFKRLSGEDVGLTGAVDQWGIGVALYHCLTGRPPFRAEAFLPLMSAIESNPFPPIRLMERFGLKEVPAGVQRVVTRLLEKRAEDRYPAAAAAAAALRGAADELTGPRSIRRPFAKLEDGPAGDAERTDRSKASRVNGAAAARPSENETLHAADSGRWGGPEEIDTSKERRPQVEAEEDDAGRTERWSQSEIDLYDTMRQSPMASQAPKRAQPQVVGVESRVMSDPAEGAPAPRKTPPPPAPSTVARRPADDPDETIPDLGSGARDLTPAPAPVVVASALVSPDFDQPLARERHAVRSVSVIPGIGIPVSSAKVASVVVEKGPAEPAPAPLPAPLRAPAPARREVAIPLKVVLLIVVLTVAAAFSLGWLLRGH